jgi:IPT/TIG domain
LYGHDFGPLGTTVDRAYLYSPSDAGIVFDAADCTVSVADTTIICFTPDGAGTDLLWSVVIGGQKSSARTVAYAAPEIHSFACSPSPCDTLDTTGGDTIVVSGINFGPATRAPNFLAGAYGGVYFLASTGTGGARIALLSCNVTVSQVQVECVTPPVFGVGLSLAMIVLRHASAPVLGAVSFALPRVSQIGVGAATGGVLLVKGNKVIVSGQNLGAPGFLVLNERVVAWANVEPGHHEMVFSVDVLPLSVIGEPNVSARVSLQGINSNAVWVRAASPAISSTFPLAIQDAQPAGGTCAGVSALYWVALSGTNFGINSSTTSLSTVGMSGTSLVCSITDTATGGSTLVFGTNATSGSLSLVMGHLSSARVVFNANDLLQPPTLSKILNATSARPADTTFRTSGGDVLRIVGTNFHASHVVYLAPIGVSDAGALPADARHSLSVCVTIPNGITASAIDCIVPTGVGSHRIVALFARGAFVANMGLFLAYSAPNVTSIAVLSAGAQQLSNAGGLISIHGTSYGTQAGNVTVSVGGLPCPIFGAVRDTGFECNAPASDEGSPVVEVNVGGQIAFDHKYILYLYLYLYLRG